ncbi:MAG: hypothetical protein ABSC15_06790 [Terriglobales bacterium]|jgi:photosystem II stability/assembly factor-like uncharacterized protein
MNYTNVKCAARQVVVFLFILSFAASAQDVPPNILQAMQWRLIGPHRGGRITSVSGVPGQPSVYYIGTPGGGVWKTENGGRVWKPIFDQVRVGSIGSVAVAPSDARIVYVGTGEQTPGNGVYKSTDAGLTWTNIGLRETHIITGIIVDPRNPDAVLVAAAGDHFSAAERGIYKTTDGGKNWQKVLYKDPETGVPDITADPDNPSILYASHWTRPDDPFSSDEPEKKKEQDGVIYKSVDQGSTWNAVVGKGLPTDPMGRIGVAVAPGTNGMRVYAIVTQGLFRSEDGGASWQRSTTDPRILGSSYFSRVFVDPKNADFVYVAQTSMYRSKDGGRTFEAWAGAPSGDDYHVLWINPANTQHMVIGVDQGAATSVDGGDTWSSWYNQPTGQFYHVSTDQHFPYYVYAAQQDSGTAAVPSRSDYGEITYRDWAPTGGFEFCYITPDPANPNFVYAGGWYGTVLRFDKTTGQIVHLLVRNSRYRTSNMVPIAFAPQDPHTLYAATQYLLKSNDGGLTWQEVSPDLTQKTEPDKKKVDPRRTVIDTIALSTVKAGVIWAGTGNGLVQVTKDGKTWQNVTIPGLHEKSSITAIEASRHDAATAYVVVSGFRDLRPLIYRTRDYGQSWQLTNTGLPETGSARMVREDPVRKGLLFAGTWNGVYFSLDDGDHWETLQQNLPTTMVTDLDVHDTDLVASTFGRSLWILDDITPLRQFDAKWPRSDAHLLSPRSVVRVRWDMSQDTPLPPETPAGDNPPDGATIYYFLKSAPAGDIKLSIYDSHNNLVHEFSNIPAPYDKAPANAPEYWFAPQPALTKTAGLNRFTWDLRYPAMKTLRYSYWGNQLDYIEYTGSDHAIPGDFPRDLQPGAFVVPGQYLLALEVNGKTYRQSLTVTLDPRVQASQADLVKQLDVETNVSDQMAATYDGDVQARALRAAIADRQKSIGTDAAKKDVADALKALDDQVVDADDGKPDELGLGPLNRELARLAFMIESGDARPASLLEASVEQYCQELGKRLAQWRDINQQKIAPVNALLQKQGLSPLPIAANIPATPKCEK